MDRSLPCDLAGEEVWLLSARALWWPLGSTLFVADLHLGKAAAFRARGVPLPGGTTRRNLARLSELIERVDADRVVILGDLFHNRDEALPQFRQNLAAWRQQHGATEMLLVPGNHDPLSEDLCQSVGIHHAQGPCALGPWILTHDPVPRPGGYVLGGHLHPGVQIRGRARQAMRLPAFIVGTERAVLPAFGELTGLVMVTKQKGDRLFAVSPHRVVELLR